jgi:CDP-diacylglycerol pyrophosphatase
LKRHSGRVWRWLWLLAALCSLPAAADPDALWHIVHEQCVPRQRAGLAPSPCAAVDLSQGEDRGHAVLKSQAGGLQYLLIPTAKTSGIESPALTRADAPAYWRAAWQARTFMAQRYGKPIARNAVALAINSAYGRSQQQLHIHVSCADPGVYATVDALKNRLNDQWQALPSRLMGHAYQARRLDALPGDLPAQEPFRLIAQAKSASADEMGHFSLAMLALTFADGQPGFALLLDHTDAVNGDHASAEELQDHSCAILRPQ